MTETDAGNDDLDVFERFNRAMGQGVVTDPYPDFAPLRTDHVAPVDLRYQMWLLSRDRHDGQDRAADPTAETGRAETDRAELVDLDLPPVFTAASFDAVYEVLRDGTRFSSAGYGETMGQVMGRTILQMDEPEHQGYRRLLLQAFTRRAMQRWEVELVRPVIERHLDALLATGEDRAELVYQLTFPFPLDVIAGLFALPEDQHRLFHRLAVAVISVGVDTPGALRASQELANLLLPLIDERRQSQGGDLISLLAQAEHDGQRLTDDEILAFCRLLLPAGAETTYRSSSNLLVGLLTHPDQLDAVLRDRALVPQAIEEGLRWEPPLLTIMRTATVDTEVCGVAIPQGAVVVVNLGSANHDERRWQDPERFDIFRPPQPHVAFASGPHLCLGMHLSRLETQIALDGLLDRLPNLRLDPDAEPPAITGHTFRSPSAIHVVFG